MTQATRERNEEGRYTSQHGVTQEDVLETMKPNEPYTTRELADELNAPRRTIYNYLENLSNANQIRKKKPEPRRAIWIKEE